MWDRRAQYVDNHDGDTVHMVLDQGFGDTKDVEIRLLGVFAPELNQVGGPECKEFVQSWFAQNKLTASKSWAYVVTTARMKVADHEQTTFGRYVATITNLDGTSNLNLEIIQFISSKGYGGGTGA